VVPLVGSIDITTERGPATLIVAQAGFPLPRDDAIAEVAPLFTPALVAMTLTETVQEERGRIATPAIWNTLPPSAADTVPPHEPVAPDGVAITRPGDKEEPKATLSVRGPLFRIVNDSVVVLPRAIVGAPKFIESVGAYAKDGKVNPAIVKVMEKANSAARKIPPTCGIAACSSVLSCRITWSSDHCGTCIHERGSTLNLTGFRRGGTVWPTIGSGPDCELRCGVVLREMKR
jgi:hypothetical protein